MLHNGMERLVSAINGKASDRIPVFCNMLDQGAKELGISLKEYFTNGESVAEAQLKMQKKYKHDNVWSLFYVGKEAELLGCKKILFAEDGPPNVEDFVIKSFEDIEKLQTPGDIASHPAFEEAAKCLKILKGEVGGKSPICAYISSSMTIPVMLMGMEKWLELMFIGPFELRDMLLEKCNDFFIKEVKAYRDGGADVIVYSNPFGSTDIVPMSFFMETSLKWIKKDISGVGTSGMVYYCGMARFNDVINTVIEQTGIGVYYISPLDDLAEAKRIIAGRALTCGVFNDIKLIDWSESEIKDEVKRIIDAGMPGGKFLFGTGVMPYSIPEKNIRIMLEAAYEYGAFK
ncbi:MAG: uroporphyrinogen decarboxylase family protein [bacterium]